MIVLNKFLKMLKFLIDFAFFRRDLMKFVGFQEISGNSDGPKTQISDHLAKAGGPEFLDFGPAPERVGTDRSHIKP